MFVLFAVTGNNVLRRNGMLNSEKVILMTKLALYEQNEGKKEIPISRYFKGDYISIHMIGSFFALTLCFAMVFLLWAVCNIEYLIDNIVGMDLIAFGKKILLLYVALLIVYLIFSYIYYSYKFKKIRQNLKSYNGGLKKLHKIQEAEIGNTVTGRTVLSKAISEARGGGSNNDTIGI